MRGPRRRRQLGAARPPIRVTLQAARPAPPPDPGVASPTSFLFLQLHPVTDGWGVKTQLPHSWRVSPASECPWGPAEAKASLQPKGSPCPAAHPEILPQYIPSLSSSQSPSPGNPAGGVAFPFLARPEAGCWGRGSRQERRKSPLPSHCLGPQPCLPGRAVLSGHGTRWPERGARGRAPGSADDRGRSRLARPALPQ